MGAYSSIAMVSFVIFTCKLNCSKPIKQIICCFNNVSGSFNKFEKSNRYKKLETSVSFFLYEFTLIYNSADMRNHKVSFSGTSSISYGIRFILNASILSLNLGFTPLLFLVIYIT